MFLLLFSATLTLASSIPVILDGEFTPKEIYLKMNEVPVSSDENDADIELKRTKTITCLHSLKNDSYQCRFKVSNQGEVSSFEQDLIELRKPYEACYNEHFSKLYGSKNTAFYGNLNAASAQARLYCDLK